MKGLIQRVSCASVSVAGEIVGQIDHGVLLFVGVEVDDTEQRCRRLAERVLNYRIFPDQNDKMNLNVQEAKGALLVVSQFTLSADTSNGNRASFTSSARPEKARVLYNQFVSHLQSFDIQVETGCFGADMQVSLTNSGPVTFLLQA